MSTWPCCHTHERAGWGETMSIHDDRPANADREPITRILELEAGSRTWLNSARVVNLVVRAFVQDLLLNLDGRDTFADWLQSESQRLNDLFLGIEPSETYATGPWNVPEQCGRYVLRILGIDGAPQTAVRDAFVLLASRIVDLVATSTFDAAALENEIVPVTRALLGTAEIA